MVLEITPIIIQRSHLNDFVKGGRQRLLLYEHVNQWNSRTPCVAVREEG